MDRLVKNKAVVAIAVVAAVLGCYFFFIQSEPNHVENDPVFSELAQEDNDIPEEEVAKEPIVIKVDVKGAVRTPGVYMAEPGDRVIDVIAAAGDFTKKANLDKVNLAQVVEDQMVIYVPTIGEEDDAETVLSNLSTSTGEAAVASISGKGSSGKALVNLNTATQAELETLTGIGPSKAIAIIEYRETTGKYQQIEDLKNISGIGDKTFEKLKDSITVK